MELPSKDLVVIGPAQATSDGHCDIHTSLASEAKIIQSCPCMLLRLQSCKVANVPIMHLYLIGDQCMDAECLHANC